MTDRKYVLLLLWAATVFSLQTTRAQDSTRTDGVLRVSVSLDDEPLGYAYLSVNGKVRGVADSNGIFLIELSTLTYGDTVSASYVGLKPVQAFYDGRKTSISLTLTSSLDIGDVLVTAKDRSVKHFKKYVRVHPVTFDYAMHCYDFDLSRKVPQELTGDAFDGQFLFTDLPHHYQKLSSERGIGVLSKKDQVGFDAVLDSILMNIHIAAVMQVPTHKELKSGDSFKVSYKGTKDNMHVFLLTDPPSDALESAGIKHFQSMLFIDQVTKEVLSAHCDIRTHQMNMHLNISYKINRKYDILYPDFINAKVTILGATAGEHYYDINMNNAWIKTYPRTLIVSEWVKHSSFKISKKELRVRSMLNKWASDNRIYK